MNATISQLNAAVDAAYRAAQSDFSKCDFASFLNSLASSLRTDTSAHKSLLQLDAAMRETGIDTHWDD